MNATMLLVCLAGSAVTGQANKLVFQAPLIDVWSRTEEGLEYRYLMHNRTYLGNNFLKPAAKKDWGNPRVDLSRMPTTYWHDKSPVGMVLQKFNWFPGPENTYHADARMPAAMIGIGGNPWGQLVNLWSEPPFAVLGLEVGAMASYARPGQTIHFTERVPTFVKLSLPGQGKTPVFTYVQDALDRGANLTVYPGEPRAMIEKHGGENFYHAIIIETYKFPDAVVHKELMTKDAITMLLGKLTEDGVLCFHTSNRFYDLVAILASAAAELHLGCVVGKDAPPRGQRSTRFASEWVMIARKPAYLAHLKAPAGAKEFRPYWQTPDFVDDRLVWNDKGERSLRGVYRSDPEIDKLHNNIYELEDFLRARTGIQLNPSGDLTRFLHGVIGILSDRSARRKNRGFEKVINRGDRKVAFEAPGIQVITTKDEGAVYSYLLYDGIYIGRSYHRPRDPAARGDPIRDRSRFPTTYFHDKSPLGVLLQKYNWFPGAENTFHADARLPASLTGMGLDPLGQLTHLWSEPPIAVVGMDVGTVASYARPAQAIHFFERVPLFVKLSSPAKGKRPYFHYLEDARARGAAVSIFQGEPRPTLKKHGGEGFYQLIVVNAYKDGIRTVHKDLMTTEGLRLLMSRTRAGGVLCFHTSNRYYDLAPILASTAKEAGYSVVVGTDTATWPDDRDRDRFTSWWVMVARKPADLAGLKAPPGYEKAQPWSDAPFWGPPTGMDKKFIWRDNAENSFRGVYRSDPTVDLFGNSVSKLTNWISDSTGIPQYSMYRMMQPVQEGIRAWSSRSARELNREPTAPKN